MKKTIIFCLSILFLSGAFAQEFKTVKVNVLKEEVIIDKFVVSKTTSIDEVIKALGKPERIEQFAGKDRKFIYDSKGVSFSIVPNNPKNLIEALIITYTYDQDKDVAKEKFSGTLSIDGFTVTEKNTAEEISESTDLKKVECFGRTCMTDPKAKGIILMMGLTDEKDILQIAFGFKK